MKSPLGEAAGVLRSPRSAPRYAQLSKDDGLDGIDLEDGTPRLFTTTRPSFGIDGHPADSRDRSPVKEWLGTSWVRRLDNAIIRATERLVKRLHDEVEGPEARAAVSSRSRKERERMVVDGVDGVVIG